METRRIEIGNAKTENNVFLAPLAGYTDFAFREICEDFGAGLTFTEMVSAKGLFYNKEGNARILRTADNGKIKGTQIFGNDPEIMRRACESEELSSFDVIDINMGCPVPKIFTNHEGSYLLSDFSLAEKIISECVKSGKNITVKYRIGLKDKEYVSEEFAKMAEGAGAKMITIHGRVREAYYAGEVNYGEIYKAKNAVSIPVIANGGIFSVEDADKMMDKTGADGVMIARGALYKPYIFALLTGKKCEIDLKKIILRHIDGLKTQFDDGYIAVIFRKFIPNYFKGMHIDREIKMKFMSAKSTNEIKELLNLVL